MIYFLERLAHTPLDFEIPESYKIPSKDYTQHITLYIHDSRGRVGFSHQEQQRL